MSLHESMPLEPNYDNSDSTPVYDIVHGIPDLVTSTVNDDPGSRLITVSPFIDPSERVRQTRLHEAIVVGAGKYGAAALEKAMGPVSTPQPSTARGVSAMFAGRTRQPQGLFDTTHPVDKAS